jgi:hypothetical protein
VSGRAVVGVSEFERERERERLNFNAHTWMGAGDLFEPWSAYDDVTDTSMALLRAANEHFRAELRHRMELSP